MMPDQFPTSHLQPTNKSVDGGERGVEAIVLSDHSKRLYSWISLDLELSIFHNVPPKLAVGSVTSPGFSPLQYDRRFTSLTAIFETFAEFQHDVTDICLRMLLHPLQCLSAHLHQFLSTFDSIQESRNSALGLASKAFIDELNLLLDRWYALATSVTSKPTPISPVTQSSLILYHLMAQDNLASFPNIERLIMEGPSNQAQGYDTRLWMRTPSPASAALLLFHCGQVLFHLRTMSRANRPLWWAAALHHTVLLLCQTIISNQASGIAFDIGMSHNTCLVSLDKDYTLGGAEKDMALQRFLNRLQGTPVLTRLDGSTMLVGRVVDVLD
jgi:hypothetical protein